MNKYKKWSITVILILMLIFGALGGIVYYFDPYIHFHKPYEGVAYELGNYVYQNDGITKNFNYDAIITGTSMTEKFRVAEINEMWGVNSIRLTFLGEGFRRINDNLEKAFSTHNDIKLVIRGVDPIWFVCDQEFLGYGDYSEYPTYLYDGGLVNDLKYIYNADVIYDEVLPIIKRTFSREKVRSFDDFEYDVKGSKELVLNAYDRPEKMVKEVTEDETKDFMEMLDRNLTVNVTDIIKSHPKTKFIIFFPPYNITFWDGLNQSGKAVLNRRIDFEQYAIEKILEYDNVEMYSFNDCFEITTNLDNYIDDLHYTPEINSYMLKCIKKGEHRLDKNNYMNYIMKIREFYNNYDYESIFVNK